MYDAAGYLLCVVPEPHNVVEVPLFLSKKKPQLILMISEILSILGL